MLPRSLLLLASVPFSYCWPIDTRSGEPEYPATRRGPRFLGLLGLLTGLTLVDSLDDDDSDRPRRSGFVKIDVGRPSFDPYYGAYGYGAGSVNPYWAGPGGSGIGSSINIKIPFRPGGPGGGEFGTMALIPFPVQFPGGAPGPHFPGGSLSSHGPVGIEPRPSIFSDLGAATGSHGTTVHADEEAAGRKQPKKSTRLKVNPPRATRSTVDEDPDDDSEPVPPVEESVSEDQPTEVPVTESDSAIADIACIASSSTPSPANQSTAPQIEESIPEAADPPATLASIVQHGTPQPGYPAHQHSLADVSLIDLTSRTDDPRGGGFQASQDDHWQNYYGTSAARQPDDHRRANDHRSGFFPIVSTH
ncbi:uncharacterized protein LOC131206555 [Anopheles bellator]|uniref:uncharacterized protein LOC131206555 n=1 Tax=Anopheles bellator TaxID=139047 RepID=UPI002647F3E6|nr:uncharacterized protein LOC131206555 [Anopheles bellator]